MALPYTQIEALTREFVIPNLADNIFEDNVLLYRLTNGGKNRGTNIDGGKKIDQPLKYAKITAVGSYSGYDTLNTDPNETITRGIFDWRQCYASISKSGFEDAVNSGSMAIINLMKEKMDNALESMKDNMATQLFSDGTGNGGKDIDGLIAAVDDGTNVATYGSIDRTTYTWWKANYTNWAATAATEAALQSAISAAKHNNKKPTLAVCDQDFFDHYWGLLEPNRRFSSETLAKVGFENIQIGGALLVTDSHCTSTDCWLLTESELHFYTHPKRNFILTPFRRPAAQDAEVAQYLWMGNLTSSECRVQNRIHSINLAL